MGYPGLTLDFPDHSKQTVPGWVFTSTELNHAWEELDAFEGPEYRRIEAKVTLDSGDKVWAWVYALR